MPTYRLTLEYNGTRYSGWQEQRNSRTVAGELRGAIGRATGQRVVDLGGSGRTDAGVHALGQVAHVRLASRIDPEPVRRAINEELPGDVHLLALEPAADRFHARHDAVLRSYVYQLARRRTAFGRRFVWWVKRPLEPRRMAEAAELIVGRHDFEAFAEPNPQQTSTLVEVQTAEVVADGALVLVRIAASHFLWKMVRRLVGALVLVGTGEWRADDVAALLDGYDLDPALGTVAEATAPAMGLFLERVVYPGDPPLGPLAAPVPVGAEPGPAPPRRR